MKILVLEVPGLRAGYLGCYGNDWVATPNLDALAAKGVVFDRHFAEASPPRDVAVGHVVPVARFDSLTDDVLAAANQHDLIWAKLPSLEPPWTLPDDLLDAYREEEEEDDFRRRQNDYAAVVTYIDAQIGKLVEKLDDVTIWVHAAIGLGPETKELIHLPCIVRFADGAAAGLRVLALTQPSDIRATLSPMPGSGFGLAPLTAEQTSAIHERIRIDLPDGVMHRTLEWAILVKPGQEPALYGQPEDPWLVSDLRQQNLEVAEELLAAIEKS